jgi:hypothetical protein
VSRAVKNPLRLKKAAGFFIDNPMEDAKKFGL